MCQSKWCIHAATNNYRGNLLIENVKIMPIAMNKKLNNYDSFLCVLHRHWKWFRFRLKTHFKTELIDKAHEQIGEREREPQQQKLAFTWFNADFIWCLLIEFIVRVSSGHAFSPYFSYSRSGFFFNKSISIFSFAKLTTDWITVLMKCWFKLN